MARLNEMTFMEHSLRARAQVFAESLDSIIARYRSGKAKLVTAGDNVKLGNTLDAFKFPAHFTCRPGIACDACRHCHSMDPADYADHTKAEGDVGYCYCMKGRQAMTNCQVSYWRQFRLATEAPEIFRELVDKQLKARAIEAGTDKARFFDTGDDCEDSILESIEYVTKSNAGLKFMFFSKWYERTNAGVESGALDLSNVTPIISADAGVNVHDDTTVNPNHLPISVVVDQATEAELKQALPAYVNEYIICPGTGTGCEACGWKCWGLQLEQAVIFIKH